MNTLTTKINDFLYYIGVNDRDTQLFENQWPLPLGVSYNSYLIVSDKTCLMDTVKITKVEEFIDKLRETLKGKPLDYLVIHHMEPDHSGSIETIRTLFPNVQLVGNKKTAEFLEHFYNIPQEDVMILKNDDILDLGERKLRFIMTPMVHWPESMVSYEEKSKTLFSQDIFGGFDALSGPIFDDQIRWTEIANSTSRYYANVVGKYSKQAAMALKKLANLDISMICPVHGPIWRTNPQKIINLYVNLSNFEAEEGVVIPYGSMYGNTETIAETLARFLADEGIKNIKLYDASKVHASYIINEIFKYRGLILGSCSYDNKLFPPMKNLVNIIEENKIKNRVVGAFGSYSWSGGALRQLNEFLDTQNIDRLETTFEVRCSMKEEDIEKCRMLAKECAEKLKTYRDKNINNILDLC